MATKKTENTSSDAGVADVQAKSDVETDVGTQGGFRVDPTPLEHYTLSGVNAGKPTPETDPDALAAAREASSHSRG